MGWAGGGEVIVPCTHTKKLANDSNPALVITQDMGHRSAFTKAIPKKQWRPMEPLQPSWSR